MEPDARTRELGASDKIIEGERHLCELSRRVAAVELVLLERRISRLETIVTKKESE
jgi:hypothetical protein